MNKWRNTQWLCRVLAGLAFIATFLWIFWFQPQMIGYHAVTRDSASYVAAGSNPAAVVLSVMGIALFCLLMNFEVRVGEYRSAPLQLRLAAFLLDMWFLFFVIGGVGSLFPLLLEARRTGTFRWHFERNYSEPTDDIQAALILLFLAGMVMYFIWPLARRRRTVGCWICGLATVSANGSALRLPVSTAAWRVFMEFNGLIHFIRTVRETDSQGRTWYDRETGFMVVRD